ncbi:hypothetical protein [Rhizobium leguminosarum]|uniref:hypothetical protein n=1 Tax=Rhizobium leguminosarum TaxID=384 RepID=UPI0012F8F91A|nr:hypothetical protein [Rhizobium leguminosarum]
MNALNAQGNMVGLAATGILPARRQASCPRGDRHPARAATGILPARNDRVCSAFPGLVIFLKHESVFGRLDERWDMSGSS